MRRIFAYLVVILITALGVNSSYALSSTSISELTTASAKVTAKCFAAIGAQRRMDATKEDLAASNKVLNELRSEVTKLQEQFTLALNENKGELTRATQEQIEKLKESSDYIALIKMKK